MAVEKHSRGLVVMRGMGYGSAGRLFEACKCAWRELALDALATEAMVGLCDAKLGVAGIRRWQFCLLGNAPS